MFDSRSPIVKIGGYVIIGFFTIIIIISFGVPDFMSRLGLDQSIVANVNGEKIHIMDYLRYRDRASGRYKKMDGKQQQRQILYDMIRYRLQLQKARELGIRVSDVKVKKFIKELPMFKDNSGKFDPERFNTFLSHYRMGLVEYYDMIKEVLIDEEMREMLKMGIAVSPDEVISQNAIEKSRIRIKYCQISSKDLRKSLMSRVVVTDKEINDELKKNPGEIKDPKTDKNRIKKKLERNKFEKLKSDIVKKIDKLAFAGKSFEEAVAVLGGQVNISRDFKIGSPVREAGAKGKVLYSLSNSKIFRDDCLAIDIGKTSRAISTIEGIYIFTPIEKNIMMNRPPESEYSAIESKLIDSKFRSVYIAMMTKFREKSRIIENLKYDKK